jgi:isochorismate synthase
MNKGRNKLIFDTEDSFVAYSLPGKSSYCLLHSKDLDGAENAVSSPHPFCISNFLKEKNNYTFDHLTENTPFEFSPSQKTKLLSTDKDKYISDTKKIIREINAGAYQKLVYSRVKHVDRSEQGVAELFLRLVEEHRSAFVFCYHIPERGCWMGATPELLVKKEAGQYKTMALAGTQLDLGLPLTKVVWGEKEKAEQEFIVDFVRQELTKRSTPFSMSDNRTVKAGEVLHICTDFLIGQEGINITDIAEYLHPGPAISGTPKEMAIERIGQLEAHDREDYCGYLGPLGEECALYINLRSMQIFEDAYILYLGGGITYDSDAEEEWKETEDKSKTLMHLIEKSYTS